MNRQRILWLLAVGVIGGLDLEAAAEKNSSARVQETAALLKVLDVQIELQDLKEGVTFTSLEQWLLTRGRELPIYFDTKAFKEESSRGILRGELPPPRLSGLPRRMRVGDLLQLLVAQFEEESTLLIRKNRVEITTRKAASRENLLAQTFVAGFDQQPLEQVLDDLADMTGVSVIVDGRCKDKIRTPVTARFHNDVPLGDALRMVTESADLKLLILPGGVFVTTALHAEVLEKDGPTSASWRPRLAAQTRRAAPQLATSGPR